MWRDFINGIRAGAYSDDERVYVPVLYGIAAALVAASLWRIF